MLKRICDFLAGPQMTAAACLSLILSFFGPELPADPAWFAVAVCGVPLVYLAVYRIINNPGIKKISSALLIVIGMTAALAMGDIFAAGEVAFIMSLGAIIEDWTVDRAKRGIKGLIELAPREGRVVRGASEQMVPMADIAQGDILRVRPGEVIPVDGVVTAGVTTVDQSVMTGEAMPVDKEPGDEVLCGTMNVHGSVDIEARGVGGDSSLSRVIRMVREAEADQAPIQRVADAAAAWLVPCALAIAIAAWLVTGEASRAVTVLVVFCPCALVLATPTAIAAAIGQAAKHGVIIKSGDALEKMGRVKVAAFDKTGTITVGRPSVSDAVSLCELSGDELLALAASAEARSEHPLGRAIAAGAEARGLKPSEPGDFRMTAGRGVCAIVDGARVLCGSERFMSENGIELPPEAMEAANRLRGEGKSVIFVARDGLCAGLAALSDTARPMAADAVRELHALGVRTVMLTGDSAAAAAAFARIAGVAETAAELLPDGKVNWIAERERAGEPVCMVGDGVNDAPALKLASVGAAMGGAGSDIAVEAADIVLMSDDISRVPYLKRLSDGTVFTIKLSITLSLVINAVAVTCSFMGLLTPTTGALVHNAGSCFVVLIAALLYDRNFERRPASAA